MPEGILLPVEPDGSGMEGFDDEMIEEAVGRGRYFRSPDRDCDHCGETYGSVTVDRSDDTARCDTCQNDPKTFDDS